MNAKAREYIKIHWVAMLWGAIPPIVVAVITLVNIFVAFRIDYNQLKTTVQANNDQISILSNEFNTGQNTQNLQLAKVLQSEADQQTQLTVINGQVASIYTILTKK